MSKRDLTGLFFTILCMGFYGWLLNHYAINIPKWDDHALKGFIENVNKAEGWQAQGAEFLRQHNEHRITLTRIFAWLDYKLFGELNFVHLMYCGSVALLLIWWFFTRFFTPLKGNYSFTVPIALCWFSLAFYENTFWGMAAVQNFWVVAWALLAFWLLARQDKHWVWALAVMVVGFYTSGNGALIMPIGLGILLLQKRFKPALLWLVACIMCAYLYFYDYSRPPVEFIVKNDFGLAVKGFFYLCGSFYESLPFGRQPFQAVLWGGVLVFFVNALLLLYILRSYWKRHFALDAHDYFYLGGVSFALATIVLVTYARAGIGAEALTVSRYKLYSVILICFNMAYLIRMVSARFREVLNVSFIVASAFFYICNQHYYLQNTIDTRRYLTTACFNWENDGASSRSKSNPIYKEPLLYIDALRGYKADTQQAKTTYSIQNQTITIKNANYTNVDLRDGGLYLVLANDKNRYIFPYHQQRKHSFRNLLNYNRFYGNIAECTIFLPESYLKPGRYVMQSFDKGVLKIDPQVLIEIPTHETKSLKMNW
jgi:hypothetical protein